MTPDPRCCTPDMAQKVFYEFAMFGFLFEKLQYAARESPIFLPGEMVEVGTSPMSTPQKREVFARLESFLLHTRVLRDFFFRTPKYDDDVVAMYFIPDWDKHCPGKGAYLEKREKRLDKALAHLTTKRFEYDTDEKQWDVTAIHGELQPVIDLFVAKLPEERRAWFVEPVDPDL